MSQEDALEAVRQRAFELFEQRGCVPGGDLDDWLRAEKDLSIVLQAEILTPAFDSRDLEAIASALSQGGAKPVEAPEKTIQPVPVAVAAG